MAERMRIVVAEHGGHEPGDRAAAIARALRDAGMEVVYTGPGQAPEQIVRAVVQEDSDALLVSTDDNRAEAVVDRIATLLAEHDAADVAIFAVGAQADGDPSQSAAATIFATGTTVDDIVARLRREVGPQGPG